MKFRYAVSFLLEVDGPPLGTVAETPPPLLRRLADAGAEQVIEAVTMLVDDELNAHHEGATKCGVTFNDAVSFEAEFIEARDDDPIPHAVRWTRRDGDRRPVDVQPVKRGTPAKGGKVPEPTRRKRRGQKGPLST